MKTIGIIGGMSWESTAEYYRLINLGIKNTLGGLHSAKIILYSVDFAEVEELQHEGRWDEAATILRSAAEAVEAGGADCLLIATNTMHIVADKVESAVDIPLLHIADCTAQALRADGITKVGLLGTRFTMSEDFYQGRLTDQFNIKVLTPSIDAQEEVHRVIYDELCHGEINIDSKKSYLEVVHDLHMQGAEAVILGCTEISMLLGANDTLVPLYDTTAIHAQKAVEFALS
jgi:aspartate racemase